MSKRPTKRGLHIHKETYKKDLLALEELCGVQRSDCVWHRWARLRNICQKRPTKRGLEIGKETYKRDLLALEELCGLHRSDCVWHRWARLRNISQKRPAKETYVCAKRPMQET